MKRHRSHTEAARVLRQHHVAPPAEEAVWEVIRNRRLAGLNFRRQHPTGPFIADFCCPEARLIIDIDGPIHDAPDHAAQDIARSELLSARGYRLIRFTNEEVLTDLETTRAQIAQAASPSLSRPPSHADTPLPCEGEGLGGEG